MCSSRHRLSAFILLIPAAAIASPAQTDMTRGIDRTCSLDNKRVITREDMERSGAITLADAIRRTPSRSIHSLPECQDKNQDKDEAADREALIDSYRQVAA